MNFGEFRTKIAQLTFPIGEAENLVDFNTNFIIDGLVECQQYIPAFRTRHVDVVPFGTTQYSCGLSLLQAPDGVIKRIYTVSSNFCCQVNYRRSTLARMRWQEAANKLEVPSHTSPTQPDGQEELPFGVLTPDASADSTLGRANEGWWAVEGCKLYLWPSIQSSEDVVIHWSGIKSTYANSDILFAPAQRLYPVIRTRLLRDNARYLEFDDAAALKFDSLYRDALGDLYHWEQQKLNGSWDESERLPTITNGCLIQESITATAPDPAPSVTDTVFAIIGSYGTSSIDALNVSNMVRSWAPEFVVTTGNNNSTGLGSFASYDSVVGSRYHPYLYPYSGLFGAGSTDHNRFWPAVGPDDRSDSMMLAAYKQFFAGVPAENDRLYYTRIEGPVQFFFIDGDEAQAAGNTSDSAQAEWLRIQLSLSIAPFKIVVVCQPPYSSCADDFPDLRWPFKTWGATLVLDGYNDVYERITTGDMTYITVGTSGDTLSTFDATLASGSIFRYNTNFGAMRGTVSCDSLTLQFISVDGVVQDSIAISKNGAVVNAPVVTTTPVSSGTGDTSGGSGSSLVDVQRVFTYAGDPNGHVTAPSPAVCLDTTGGIIWWKDDGITSNTGWH